MYSLIATQLDVDKKRVYALDGVHTAALAAVHAKDLALYTAMQMAALGGKPEVWCNTTTKTWELLHLGSVVVRIEIARQRKFPHEQIEGTALVWQSIGYNERG